MVPNPKYLIRGHDKEVVLSHVDAHIARIFVNGQQYKTNNSYCITCLSKLIEQI